MKVLVVHNRYQQPGGEDAVVRREVALLRRYGHDVSEWSDDNARIDEIPRVRLALDTIWSSSAYQHLRDRASDWRPDIVHFHNTLPLISPAGYYAVRAAGAAVVQTVHNYRLVCPGGLLHRDGHLCEDCVGRMAPWPAVVHGCYRHSRAASGVVASMLVVHRAIGTWRRGVHAYVALTAFVRDKLVAGGLSPDRVFVKPNFAESPVRMADPGLTEAFLYVGRLSAEKGVGVLIDAWRALGSTAPPLRIVGDGPERAELMTQARDVRSIEWLGWCAPDRVATLMAESAALVVPSLWYEAFPAVVTEAFAIGLPVLASDLGSLASLVQAGENGECFVSGSASSLADAVRQLAGDASRRERLGRGARAAWSELYNPDANHTLLMEIYRGARERQSSG